MLTPGGELIRQEVELRGPMTFARFMDLALYHPQHGYYQRKARPRGRGGDYFTSMQAGGLFPALMAEALVAIREQMQCEPFTFMEVGAGDGEFLRGLVEALEEKKQLRGMRVIAVEAGRAARERAVKTLSRFPKVTLVGSLDDVDLMGGLEGCIFSNELFDALPFHRLRWSGDGWKEIYVALKNGLLVEEDGPLSRPGLVPAGIETGELLPGQEIESRALSSLLEQWSSRFQRALTVTFDYGYPRRELITPRRARGTWQCFYKHTAHERAFDHIGEQDLTAHLDFTSLADEGAAQGFAPALFCTQGIFLSYTGRATIEHAIQTTAGKKAVQQLIHPDAMGEAFKVLIQAKEAALPAAWSQIPNRAARLNGAVSSSTSSKTIL